MINENAIINKLFIPNDYVEYEIPEEGKMFYSVEEEKTFYLNQIALYILEICDKKSIRDVIKLIIENCDISDTTVDEVEKDILELVNILLDNKFIEINCD